MKRFYHKILIILIIPVFFDFATGSELTLKVRYSGDLYFTEKILNASIEEISDLSYNKDGRLNFEFIEKMIIGELLDLYLEKGFPLAVVKVDSLKENENGALLYLNIDSGDYVKYNEVSFSGNKITRKDVLLQASGLNENGIFNESELKKAASLLYRTGLFEKKPVFGIIKNNKNYSIVFDVDEEKYFSFEALGGISGGEDETYINGLIYINADNIFGTMRKAALTWERTESESEDLFISYTEPFLLRSKLSASGFYSQKNRKGEYLIRRYGTKAILGTGSLYSITASYTRENIFPDSLYTGPVNDIVTDIFSGGILYSEIHNRSAIPASPGFSSSIEISSVHTRIIDSLSTDGISINTEMKFISEPFINIYTSARLKYSQIYFKEKIPELTKLTFGGINSFRGYRRDFFRTDLMSGQFFDLYIVSPKKDVALDIFFDSVQYNPQSENISDVGDISYLWSAGGGVIFKGRTGEIKFLVGVPGDSGFQAAVAHVGYSVRF